MSLSTATPPVLVPIFLKYYNQRLIARLFLSHSSLQSLYTVVMAEQVQGIPPQQNMPRRQEIQSTYKKFHHQHDSVLTSVFRGQKAQQTFYAGNVLEIGEKTEYNPIYRTVPNSAM